MNVAARFRRFILLAFQPIAKRIGHVYISFRRVKMTLTDVKEVLALVRPGDVLLCRSQGEFTNIFIPGFWTHAALYAGEKELVEAVSPCVKISPLEDFLLAKDYVAVLRPVFASGVQKLDAVNYARLQASKNIPYDYQFTPTDSAFYCAEIIGASYVYAMGGASPFTPRYSLGVLTYIPDDFYNAIQKFELIWVKNDKNVPLRAGLK